MTLFKRELRGNLRSFLIWIACLLGVTILFMAMYPSFASQGDKMNALLETYPEEILKLFSMNTLDFTRADDYYCYTFQYVLLATLIQFMMLGAGMVSREEDEGTVSFLYAKPVSRTGIIAGKYLAGVVYIGAHYVLFVMGSLAMAAAVAGSGYDPGLLFLLGAAMALGQLMMLSLGMLMSMFVVRARTILSASIGAVMGLYVLAMFVNLREELAFLRFFTPFKYFDATEILRSGQIEPAYIALALSLTAVFTAASLLLYGRRDLRSV